MGLQVGGWLLYFQSVASISCSFNFSIFFSMSNFIISIWRILFCRLIFCWSSLLIFLSMFILLFFLEPLLLTLSGSQLTFLLAVCYLYTIFSSRVGFFSVLFWFFQFYILRMVRNRYNFIIFSANFRGKQNNKIAI